MDQDQMVLFALRGMVASMPDEQRAKVEAAVKDLRATLSQYGGEGMVALGLVGAELQAEGESKGENVQEHRAC